MLHSPRLAVLAISSGAGRATSNSRPQSASLHCRLQATVQVGSFSALLNFSNDWCEPIETSSLSKSCVMDQFSILLRSYGEAEHFTLTGFHPDVISENTLSACPAFSLC